MLKFMDSSYEYAKHRSNEDLKKVVDEPYKIVKPQAKKIKTNKIQCKYCGDVIESKHDHDLVWCSCKRIAADGGKNYLRRSSRGNEDDFLELSEYEDD